MRAWPALALALALALAAVAAGAQQRQPPADPLLRAAIVNAELAIAYLKQDDVITAREKINKALEQNPRDAQVQTSAGLVFERLQELEEADRHYSTALRLAPHNSDMQNNYAVFLCRRGHFEPGRKLFEQAAKNPSNRSPEVALANAGTCARSAGNLVAAEELFRNSLALRSDYPDALIQLADLSQRRGENRQARGFLEHYFAVAPNSADALLLAVRIERALGDAAAADRYTALLMRLFPDSEQARQLRNGPGGP